MKIIYYILPVLAGIAITIQSGINAQLRAAINNPLLAAFISFLGGTITLALLLIFSKSVIPSFSVFSAVSWYKFTGGLLGVFVVTTALLSVQQIGASNMFVLIIAGQLITAVLMDSFGVLGLANSPITLQKVIGILLLVAGAYLVNKSKATT
ncbi:MAG TPA: DMT family transporter [Chitinophagaceae bacterium]|nr:DMT family transporter [Chitinophagaceae bacterium]